jgi:hypothetical protein
MIPVVFYCVVLNDNPDNDSLLRFDPVTEWLVGRSEYLTWRAWGQYVPEHSAPVAVVNKNGKFLVKTDAWSGRFAWMRHIAIQRREGAFLGTWLPSNFQGLYGLPNTLEEIQQRLDRINRYHFPDEKFAVEVSIDDYLHPSLRLQFSGGRISKLLGVRSGMIPKSIWWSIRDDLIDFHLRKQADMKF